MLEDRSSPAQEAGEAVRSLHPLRRWLEVREFFRAIYPRRGSWCYTFLTTLTISVWDHPDRFR